MGKADSRLAGVDIDVVITWVDGNDPQHRLKRNKYSRPDERMRDDKAGEVRYASSGEIYFCVASILRFAPFVHKIFIVTDGQNPHLDRFAARFFPASAIPIVVVDHKEIFRGYEQVLPTFSSLSIETMLFRIPGLSEHFVYFNDDVLLIAPLTFIDWISPDGRPVLYGYWHSTLTARILRAWKRLCRGNKAECKFRDSMLGAALLLGGGARLRFWRLLHTPLVLRRSFYEHFYQAHPEALERNIAYKFRDRHQYNPQCLFQTFAALRGEAMLRHNYPNDRDVIYVQPKAWLPDKWEEERGRLARQSEAKFLCVNTLSQASDQQRHELTEWMRERIGLPQEWEGFLLDGARQALEDENPQ